MKKKQPRNSATVESQTIAPLEGQRSVKEVVYQATITTAENTEMYVGLTATEFKTRWRNH